MSESDRSQYLIQRYLERSGYGPDSQYVATFVNLMLSNNKSRPEIAVELEGALGADASPRGLLDYVYNDLPNELSGNDHNLASTPAIATSEDAPPPAPQVDDNSDQQSHAFGGRRTQSTPRGSNHHSRFGGGGPMNRGRGGFIQKSGVGRSPYNGFPAGPKLNRDGRRDFSNRLSMGARGVKTFVPSNQSRCHHWPYCYVPNCPAVHPTEICQKFPDCLFAKGTCPNIHIGEDMSEQEYETFKANGNRLERPRMELNRHLQLCKFNSGCLNPYCERVHSSPANRSHTVKRNFLCPAGSRCSDPVCEDAHPAPVAVTKKYLIEASKSLTAKLGKDAESEELAHDKDAPPFVPAPVSTGFETCKFGSECKNPTCRFRHPLSMVPCRQGDHCTRPDCTFLHPIPTPCKFGVNCPKSICVFLHPEGYVPPHKRGNVRSGLKSYGTNERQFAASESSEKVLPGNSSQEVAMSG